MTRRQLRAWERRAKTLNWKAIALFEEMDAAGVAEHLMEPASDTMSASSGLLTALREEVQQ